MMLVLLGLLAIAFWLCCLFDVLGVAETHTRFLPRFVWFLIVLLGLVPGGLLWVAVGRPRRISTTLGPPTRAPLGPDDDPDFLKRLERRLRGEE